MVLSFRALPFSQQSLLHYALVGLTITVHFILPEFTSIIAYGIMFKKKHTDKNPYCLRYDSGISRLEYNFFRSFHLPLNRFLSCTDPFI